MFDAMTHASDLKAGFGRSHGGGLLGELLIDVGDPQITKQWSYRRIKENNSF